MSTHDLLPYVVGNVSSSRGPVPDAQTVALLLYAERHGCREEAVRLILAHRAEWKRWLTLTQRKWQTSVSRRPQRGRHHDSWRIRESYVRIHNNPLEGP